jgi:hypothetical protein
MTAGILSLVDVEEYERHLATVDAALILDEVLDLQPAGWGDDEDGDDREDQR